MLVILEGEEEDGRGREKGKREGRMEGKKDGGSILTNFGERRDGGREGGREEEFIYALLEVRVVSEYLHRGLGIGVVGRLELQVRDTCRWTNMGKKRWGVSLSVAIPPSLPPSLDAPMRSKKVLMVPIKSPKVRLRSATKPSTWEEREGGREEVLMDEGIWVPRGRSRRAGCKDGGVCGCEG